MLKEYVERFQIKKIRRIEKWLKNNDINLIEFLLDSNLFILKIGRSTSNQKEMLGIEMNTLYDILFTSEKEELPEYLLSDNKVMRKIASLRLEELENG